MAGKISKVEEARLAKERAAARREAADVKATARQRIDAAEREAAEKKIEVLRDAEPAAQALETDAAILERERHSRVEAWRQLEYAESLRRTCGEGWSAAFDVALIHFIADEARALGLAPDGLSADDLRDLVSLESASRAIDWANRHEPEVFDAVVKDRLLTAGARAAKLGIRVE
jgi:hypothetical protein